LTATVQRILGHSSITVTTSTYVDVIEQVQHDALSRLDVLFDMTTRAVAKTTLSSELSSNDSEAVPDRSDTASDLVGTTEFEIPNTVAVVLG
jgi:hypothetical protein